MPLPKLHEVDVWNRALSRVGDSRIEFQEASVGGLTVLAGNPMEIGTGAAHGVVTGDRVLLYDVVGGTEVAGRVFPVDLVDPVTLEIQREDGSAYANATSGRLQKLPDSEIVRACFDAWPRVRDEIIRAAPWNSTTRRTRLARRQTALAISAATAANPVVVTVVGHTYVAGDEALIDSIVGMVELNGRYFTVGTVVGNTFQLVNEDGLLHTAYASGGTASKVIPGLRPDFGYGYRYTVPDHVERVFELAQDPYAVWELEGDQLHCNIGPTVPIRYAHRVTDPSLWDAQLVNVMAARLAYEIAEELTASKSKREMAYEEWQAGIKEAKRADGQEQSPQDFAEDEWVFAATGGGSWDPLLPCTPRGTR